MTVPKPKKIAVVDCETLDLRISAVIWELAVGVATVDSEYAPVTQVDMWSCRIEVLPQLMVGRTTSQDTLEFSYRTHGPDFGRIVSDPTREPGNTILHPKAALETLVRKCRDVDEVWINGTSFDSGRLHSLAESFDVYREGLWVYNKENDIRTIRHRLRLPNPVTEEDLKSKHRAVADVQWNFSMLNTFGRFLALDVKSSRKVVK